MDGACANDSCVLHLLPHYILYCEDIQHVISLMISGHRLIN